MAAIHLATLRREHRARIGSILVSTGVFSNEEVDVALELFDEACPQREPWVADDLGSRDHVDYEFIGAFDGDEVVGYACFGPTPATNGTWDLYWLAVDPSVQGHGVGGSLVQWVEQDLGGRGARLLVVETSSRADYEHTRSFYARRGYVEAARVQDFYAPSDDRIILTTRLTTREAGAATR